MIPALWAGQCWGMVSTVGWSALGDGQRWGTVSAHFSHRCRAAHQHGGAAEALGHHPGRMGYTKDTDGSFLLEVGCHLLLQQLSLSLDLGQGQGAHTTCFRSAVLRLVSLR